MPHMGVMFKMSRALQYRVDVIPFGLCYLMPHMIVSTSRRFLHAIFQMVCSGRATAQ